MTPTAVIRFIADIISYVSLLRIPQEKFTKNNIIKKLVF